MIEKRTLGKSGIEASRLCFGTLTMGPLQKHLPIEEGASLMLHGFEKGINFFDTAELYETYPYIYKAMEVIKRKDMVISTKSYAYDIETAKRAVDDCLNALKTDYIDIFMMHEQESVHTIRGHYEALEYYLRLKEEGIIKAVGLSTHKVEGVLGALKYPEIEIIHPIFNKAGIGILDGSVKDMEDAIRAFKNAGGGIFAMKPLGGGHLSKGPKEALDFMKSHPLIDSIAIGMQSFDEIDFNVQFFSDQSISKDLEKRVIDREKTLHIESWCTGCGQCIERCQMDALKLVDKKASVTVDKCVLCGYCSTVCPEFAIKVV